MSLRPTLVAHLRALPGCEEQLAELLETLAAHVREEPGNITFEPYRLRDNPPEFWVYEVYKDDDAFAAHMGADHGRVFRLAIADVVENGDSVLTWLTPLNVVEQTSRSESEG